jgi:hypothetical protein
MPSRGLATPSPASSDLRASDPGLFPPEKPESRDENNKDNAFKKVTKSRDTVIVHHD